MAWPARVLSRMEGPSSAAQGARGPVFRVRDFLPALAVDGANLPTPAALARFALAALLSLLPAATIVLTATAERRRAFPPALLTLALAPLPLLFYLGWDWGRWLHLIALSAVALLLAPPQTSRAPAANSPLAAALVWLAAIAYVASWKLRHCCELASIDGGLFATPTLWRYMMQEELKAPDNTLAVSFGEPMTLDLAATMRKSGFGVLRELYGSTETGLIGWRDTPGEAFVLFDHWRSDGDGLARIGPDGAPRRVDPMDVMEWTGERSFALSGRRDGAIQIGAVNVFPDAVAAAMRSHPHIKDCEIVVGRRGDGAARLIAHILLAERVAPNERTARDIDVWCRVNLRQQERPQIYNFDAETGAEV